MDVEKTIQFVLESQAQTEAGIQRLTEQQAQTEAGIQRLTEQMERLTVAQVRVAENVLALTEIVQEQAEENQRARQANEEFHRGVDERFTALIKMMDEWIRNQGRSNGSS